MPADNKGDLPARTFVRLTLIVAILALIGALFAGVGNRLFGGTDTPEPSTKTPGNQEEIYALQTQVALQEILLTQQAQLPGSDEQLQQVTSDQELSRTPQPSSQGQSPSTTDCGKLIEGEDHNPTLGTRWEFHVASEDRIIHIWSNHWNPNLPEYKYFLPSGQSISFMSGGGSFWSERPGCDGVAEELYRRDGFQGITFDQYQQYIEQGTIP